MKPVVRALLACAVSLVRSRVALHLEILALRHQLAVYQRSTRRPHVRPSDRVLWSWLSRGWSRWREIVLFVQPATVLAWQRKRFRDHWARLNRTRPGRPSISQEIRALIREISAANPRWGSPRILGELRKVGIAVAKSTVEKYRVRPRRPPSPAWRAFLKNHVTELVSIDFFTVPTVNFTLLFVLIVLDRPHGVAPRIGGTSPSTPPAANCLAIFLGDVSSAQTSPPLAAAVGRPSSSCHRWRQETPARSDEAARSAFSIDSGRLAHHEFHGVSWGGLTSRIRGAAVLRLMSRWDVRRCLLIARHHSSRCAAG